MDHAAVLRAYRLQSVFYDWVSGPSLAAGRTRALHAIDAQPGQRLLEIGVGTGLTLPRYPEGLHITGIDLSEAMLEKARRRCIACERPDIELRTMDAQALSLPDASYDQVVAMYVLSVAPDPAQVLREMRRVCRPGGRLTVVNLITSEKPLLRGLRQILKPFGPALGFRPLFSLTHFKSIAGDLDWVSVDGREAGLCVFQAINR